MSINSAQRAQTARELTALADSLPVPREALAARLGYSPAVLEDILALDQAYPAEVWRVRDFLVSVAAHTGVEVPEFSTLKDDMRPQARRWFGGWEVPSADGLSSSSPE